MNFLNIACQNYNREYNYLKSVEERNESAKKKKKIKKKKSK